RCKQLQLYIKVTNCAVLDFLVPEKCGQLWQSTSTSAQLPGVEGGCLSFNKSLYYEKLNCYVTAFVVQSGKESAFVVNDLERSPPLWRTVWKGVRLCEVSSLIRILITTTNSLYCGYTYCFNQLCYKFLPHSMKFWIISTEMLRRTEYIVHRCLLVNWLVTGYLFINVRTMNMLCVDCCVYSILEQRKYYVKVLKVPQLTLLNNKIIITNITPCDWFEHLLLSVDCSVSSAVSVVLQLCSKFELTAVSVLLSLRPSSLSASSPSSLSSSVPLTLQILFVHFSCYDKGLLLSTTILPRGNPGINCVLIHFVIWQ
ncbi:hypothetical protein L9F63_011317, partial [Diploptera punctata]